MTFILTDWLTGLCEAIIYFMIFEAFFERKEKYGKWIYFIGIIVLTIYINVSNTIYSNSILNIIAIVLGVFLVSFLYRANIGIRLILPIFSFGIMSCFEVLVMFALMAIENKTATEIIENPNSRMWGIIISKTISLIIAKTICTIKRKKYLQVNKGYWVLFLIIVSTTLVGVFVLCRLQDDINDYTLQLLSIVSTFGLIISMFLTLYLYERMSAQNEAIANEKILKRQLEYQIEHFNEINLAQGQLRSFRHDINNHLISLNSLLKAEDYNGGIKYIENMQGIIEKSKMQGICSGNVVIDAIIFSKKNIAENKGIDFKTDLQIPNELNIEPMDISIILGNALDNAIEACDRISDTNEKYINIEMKYDGNQLKCVIENSAPPTIKSKFLRTTKADVKNHGLGIENIKKVLEKYSNVFSVEQPENEFKFSLIFFNV